MLSVFDDEINSMDDVLNKCIDILKWIKNNLIGTSIYGKVVASIVSYILDENFVIGLILSDDNHTIFYRMGIHEVIYITDLKMILDKLYAFKVINGVKTVMRIQYSVKSDCCPPDDAYYLNIE